MSIFKIVNGEKKPIVGLKLVNAQEEDRKMIEKLKEELERKDRLIKYLQELVNL